MHGNPCIFPMLFIWSDIRLDFWPELWPDFRLDFRLENEHTAWHLTRSPQTHTHTTTHHLQNPNPKRHHYPPQFSTHHPTPPSGVDSGGTTRGFILFMTRRKSSMNSTRKPKDFKYQELIIGIQCSCNLLNSVGLQVNYIEILRIQI